MNVLFVTPPLLQPNTPYAATPVLAGFLRDHGVPVAQADLSLALILELFSREGVDALARKNPKSQVPGPKSQGRRPAGPGRRAGRMPLDPDLLAEYRRWVEPVVSYLQGRAPELAWLLARDGTLPEGPHFRELVPPDADADTDLSYELFGSQGIGDLAKMRASLFLDDLADLFRDCFDPDFGFSRYAEHLADAAPSFDPILRRLRSRRPTDIDRRIDRLAEEALHRHHPTHVGITVPFPGTVYGAFRVAQAVRRADPSVRIVLGGGYVNSELRDLTDPRVFDFIDDLCFDDGFDPWLGILGLGPRVRTRTRGPVREFTGSPVSSQTSDAGLGTRDSRTPDASASCGRGPRPYAVVASDYTGLDLSAYLSLLETANPMSRLWSDGRWLKVQLAHGCYWHRCAFCDTSLDYIGCYRAPDPAQAVDAILEMRRRTGLSGFHFTDEALPPALVRALCEELLRRGETITWWGNVRLDSAFHAGLASLMARAGCIAVTAGLECANDRLLRLMRKGITVASARRACRAFAENGILVHTYLMYGFPTETEEETLGALETVRDLFAEGLVQSAFWHRFALTVHSPIARDPSAFGIKPLPPGDPATKRRFALNEIPYREPGAPDLDRLGRGLALATYNYMRGQGLDLPVSFWFSTEKSKRQK